MSGLKQVVRTVQQASQKMQRGLKVAAHGMDQLKETIAEKSKPYVDLVKRPRSTATQLKLSVAGGGLGASFLVAANLIDQSNIKLGVIMGGLSILSFVAPNIRFDKMDGKFSILEHFNFPAYVLSCALTFGGSAAGIYGLYSSDLLPKDHIFSKTPLVEKVIKPGLESGPGGMR